MISSNQRLINTVKFQIPTIGIILFLLLYLYSASLYPGGSQADVESVGFDWFHNYWCNLMNERGMNGVVNPARPYSISAMFILCASLAVFFYQFAETYCTRILWRRLIQYSGIVSMLSASMMFSQYHDVMTIVSSIFGLIALIGIIKTIIPLSFHFLKRYAVFCIALLAMNNYMYYSHHYIVLLPLIQKLTFLLVLGWIVLMNQQYRFEKNKNSS